MAKNRYGQEVPEGDPSAVSSWYHNQGTSTGGGSGRSREDNAPWYSTGVGFIDDLTGSTRAEEEANRRDERNRQDGYVDDYEGYLPGEENLIPQYQQMTAQHELGDSQAAQAYADDSSIAGQQDALSALQDVYQSGGLTEKDRAGIREGQSANARAMRSRNESVLAGMQERGMGGSGSELMAMLSGNQALGVSNAASMADINMNAQQRAQNAMLGAGNISTNMREQSFGENYKRGSAVDAFNQDNMNYRRNIQQSNNQTVNAQQDANVAGYQQSFDNRGRIMDARMGVSNARVGDSNAVTQAANARQGAIAGAALNYATGGVSGAASAAGGGDKIYDDDED